MNIEILARILAALMVFHAFHAYGEMTNVRFKVRKLKATIDGTPFKGKSFKVDTTAKFIAVEIAMIVVLAGGAYLVFSLLGLSAVALIAIAIGLLILAEVITTLGYDKYHKEIGAETSKPSQRMDRNGLPSSEPAKESARASTILGARDV